MVAGGGPKEFFKKLLPPPEEGSLEAALVDVSLLEGLAKKSWKTIPLKEWWLVLLLVLVFEWSWREARFMSSQTSSIEAPFIDWFGIGGEGEGGEGEEHVEEKHFEGELPETLLLLVLLLSIFAPGDDHMLWQGKQH